MTDHSKKLYYEVFEVDTYFRWKVYRYGTTGNHEVIVAQSDRAFDGEMDAMDAACEYLEDNDLDAEYV